MPGINDGVKLLGSPGCPTIVQDFARSEGQSNTRHATASGSRKSRTNHPRGRTPVLGSRKTSRLTT